MAEEVGKKEHSLLTGEKNYSPCLGTSNSIHDRSWTENFVCKRYVTTILRLFPDSLAILSGRIGHGW
jgi:hypothetical protein